MTQSDELLGIPETSGLTGTPEATLRWYRSVSGLRASKWGGACVIGVPTYSNGLRLKRTRVHAAV
jgi:hypothetical protein